MENLEKLQWKYELEGLLRAFDREDERMGKEFLRLTREEQAANVAYVEYQQSGLKRMLRSLLGKQDLEEQYRIEAARSKAALEQLKQTMERRKPEREAMANALEEMKDLPFPDRESPLWEKACEIRGRFLGKQLLYWLEENRQALISARDYARLDTQMERHTVEAGKADFLQEGDRCAREIGELLQALNECGYPLEVHPYFTNPAGYLMGLASEFGQLERMNQALDAIDKTNQETKLLLKKMGEPI